MKINSQNIEQYIISYLEGLLSQQEIDELFLFLSMNPQFNDLLNVIKQTKLIQDKTIKYKDKQKLKQIPLGLDDIDNLDLLCIRYYEDDLTIAEKAFLERYIEENEEASKIFKTYNILKLQPDETLKYNNKQELKFEESPEELIIAKIENELTPEQRKKIKDLLETFPEYKEQLNLYQQLKLKPYNDYYPNKNQLKKKHRYISFKPFITISVAASILFVLYILGFHYKTNEKSLIANVKPNNEVTLKQPITLKPKIKQVKQQTFAIKKHIDKNEQEIINNTLAYQEIKDTIKYQSDNTNNTQFIVNQNKTLNSNLDSVYSEILSKILANSKYNLFHEITYLLNQEEYKKQATVKISMWNILENSSQFFSKQTGKKILIKKTEVKPNRVRQEITIGNVSFTRIFSRK